MNVTHVRESVKIETYTKKSRLLINVVLGVQLTKFNLYLDSTLERCKFSFANK